MEEPELNEEPEPTELDAIAEEPEGGAEALDLQPDDLEEV